MPGDEKEKRMFFRKKHDPHGLPAPSEENRLQRANTVPAGSIQQVAAEVLVKTGEGVVDAVRDSFKLSRRQAKLEGEERRLSGDKELVTKQKLEIQEKQLELEKEESRRKAVQEQALKLAGAFSEPESLRNERAATESKINDRVNFLYKKLGKQSAKLILDMIFEGILLDLGSKKKLLQTYDFRSFSPAVDYLVENDYLDKVIISQLNDAAVKESLDVLFKIHDQRKVDLNVHYIGFVKGVSMACHDRSKEIEELTARVQELSALVEPVDTMTREDSRESLEDFYQKISEGKTGGWQK